MHSGSPADHLLTAPRAGAVEASMQSRDDLGRAPVRRHPRTLRGPGGTHCRSRSQPSTATSYGANNLSAWTSHSRTASLSADLNRRMWESRFRIGSRSPASLRQTGRAAPKRLYGARSTSSKSSPRVSHSSGSLISPTLRAAGYVSPRARSNTLSGRSPYKAFLRHVSPKAETATSRALCRIRRSIDQRPSATNLRSSCGVVQADRASANAFRTSPTRLSIYAYPFDSSIMINPAPRSASRSSGRKNSSDLPSARCDSNNAASSAARVPGPTSLRM